MTLTGAADGMDRAGIAFRARYREKTPAPPEVVFVEGDDNRLNLTLLLNALRKKPPRATVITQPLDCRALKHPAFDVVLAEKMQLVDPVLVCGEASTIHGRGGLENSQGVPVFPSVRGILFDVPESLVVSEPLAMFRAYASVGFLVREWSDRPVQVPLVYRLDRRVVPSLELAALLQYDGAMPGSAEVVLGSHIGWNAGLMRRRIPIDWRGRFLVNPRHRFEDFATLTATELLKASHLYEAGVTGPSLLDRVGGKLVVVYDGAQPPRAQMEILGNVVANVFRGDILCQPGFWARYLAPFLILVGAAWGAAWLKAPGRWALIAGLVVAGTLVSQWLFDRNLLWPWFATGVSLLMVDPWIRLYEQLWFGAGQANPVLPEKGQMIRPDIPKSERQS